MNDPNAYTGGGAWSAQHLVGHVLADRYRVEKLMGEGGMGSVYRGSHVALRKQVAIKVLHHDLCRDQTQVDRFLQEARAASMIGHENIVDIMDFGPVPGGSVFFVMEFLEGEDLADLLRREGRLTWARARSLMLQIVRALAAAHSKGIIHRDLKPANCFLVRRSDGRDFVKLLDFGIAKVTDPESGDGGGLTRTGAVFGTAKYMAPEQACGEPADQRTDIYAAAICLYEFMTGRVPYDGDNFMRVLSRHLTEPLTLPSSMAPEANISPAVEAIIVKALSKKADDRYQSMAEFEQAMLSVGPDGNLSGASLYEGPPQLGPMPAGGTMWLGHGAGGNQTPASQPPEGRGGTMLLDGERPPEYFEDPNAGQFARGPTGWSRNPSGQGAAITNAPRSRPPSVPAYSPGTRAPSPYGTSHTRMADGEYTMFASEKRSPVKLVMMLALGGLVAIGGGGLAAWMVLRGDETTDSKPVVAKQEVIPAAPVEPDPEEEEPSLEIPKEKPPEPVAEPEPNPGALEIPSSPPPEPEVVIVDEPDPEPKKDSSRARANTRSNGRSKGRTGTTRTSPPPESERKPNLPDVDPPEAPKDQLSDSDVARGFAKATKTARECPGGLPSMSIRVSATINKEGRVIAAKPLNNASLPVAKCVADAVKSRAKFAPTTRALETKEWNYTF